MPTPLGRVAVTKAAAPLPDPLQGLADSRYHVKFSRAQLCMFAGPPGGGKTTAALVMAIRSGVPTLYISADSDEVTMAAKTASHITRHPYAAVRQCQTVGLWEEEYGDQVRALPIRWMFDSGPSIEDVGNAVKAYVELWGQPPELLVVDNLLNIETAGGDEWSNLRAIMKDLLWLARKTRAAVWVLHHTSEQNDAWISSAPPRSAIHGKLSQLPEIILTIANNEGHLYVAVVKNRHGEADPHAKQPVVMSVDLSRNIIWDQPLAVTLRRSEFG